MNGKIISVNISEEKGTPKHPVQEALLVAGHGIKGDAHAGNWHRQVSLLSLEEIEAFREKASVPIPYGAFGENLVVNGLKLSGCKVGDAFRVGEACLRITQIGKECHTDCAIRQSAGDCIMPRYGVFAEVLEGGMIREGDILSSVYRTAVVTLSDRCHAGEREDTSGPVICAMLQSAGYDIVETLLLPDDKERLEAVLIRLSDVSKVDAILTTGGTGFSPRDITPEATLAVADRLAPGIAEALRAYSMTITKRAMLSRAVSVIRGSTLIINLPGSRKAVEEELSYLLDTLPHGLDILCGTGDD